MKIRYKNIKKKSLCNSCRIYNLIITGFQTVLMETESANLTPKVTHIKTHKQNQNKHTPK